MICAEDTQNKMAPVYEKSTLRQHTAMHIFISYILDLISEHVRLCKLSAMPGEIAYTPIYTTYFQKQE